VARCTSVACHNWQYAGAACPLLTTCTCSMAQLTTSGRPGNVLHPLETPWHHRCVVSKRVVLHARYLVDIGSNILHSWVAFGEVVHVSDRPCQLHLLVAASSVRVHAWVDECARASMGRACGCTRVCGRVHVHACVRARVSNSTASHIKGKTLGWGENAE
jgi:hypothetical protein